MLTSTLASLREIKFDLEHNFNADLKQGFFDSEKEKNESQDLEKAVFKTLAFFDIFGYPLTDWEIYKYLWVKNSAKKNYSYGEVKQALSQTVGVKQSSGFYFLRQDKNLVAVRKQRQVIARKKYRRALLVVRVLSLLPFIKMIGVCNTLAYDNVREDSDIDFFIITAKGKIWTSRFYATLLLKILGLRPREKNKKDKICLNFFISENNLNLEKLMIENDVYFTYWLKQLLPVYDDKIFVSFKKANRAILKSINNSNTKTFFNKRQIKQSLIEQGLKSFLEVLNCWNWLEKILKFIQLKIMPEKLFKKAKTGTGVIIGDGILKFHVDDKREEFRNTWESAISKS